MCLRLDPLFDAGYVDHRDASCRIASHESSNKRRNKYLKSWFISTNANSFHFHCGKSPQTSSQGRFDIIYTWARCDARFQRAFTHAINTRWTRVSQVGFRVISADFILSWSSRKHSFASPWVNPIKFGYNWTFVVLNFVFAKFGKFFKTHLTASLKRVSKSVVRLPPAELDRQICKHIINHNQFGEYTKMFTHIIVSLLPWTPLLASTIFFCLQRASKPTVPHVVILAVNCLSYNWRQSPKLILYSKVILG